MMCIQQVHFFIQPILYTSGDSVVNTRLLFLIRAQQGTLGVVTRAVTVRMCVCVCAQIYI